MQTGFRDNVRWFLTGIFFFLLTALYAQDRYYVILESATELKTVRLQRVNDFNTVQKRDQFLEQIIRDLHQRNWLEASIDSLYDNGTDTLIAYLHIGRKYELDIALPSVAGKVRRNSASQTTAESLPEAILAIDKQLIYWQESGYPFAEISWDSLSMDSLSLHMDAKIEKGPLIIFDSLKNREDGKISEAFLRSYLGIKKNMPYRESVLSESDQLMKKLPFVRFAKPSTVNFQGDKATINVYLAHRKVSKFDFLVGVLPNNANTGKILITGEARLQLQNAFRRGEELYLEWKRVKANSQQLKLRFSYPYILQSPIGVAGSFLLDKRDSTFLDLNWTLGVPFRTKANNYIKAYVENAQTIVLLVDTNTVKNRNKLPDIQDVSALLYGFEGYFENLDYLYNPRRGIEAGANIQVGNRKIKPNNTIRNMGDAYLALYDSIKLKSLQIQFRASFNAYIRLTNRQVIKLGVRGASKFTSGILENELYRIGGANSLRGFDEESIFTQHYAFSTAEYRFILDQNSYMYAFIDAGFTGKNGEDGFVKDFPLGFGAGIAFETKAGIFGVSYAVGRQQGNPIDFRSSKLHFGYVNIF